jgi:capsular exopolysaccharide synthesis family protein
MADEREVVDAWPSESGPGQSGPDLLAVLWRRKSLIALGGVVGLVLGAMYYARLTPTYQSSAQVLVVKKRPDALPLPGLEQQMSFMEDYLATHQVLMRSPLIIRGAVEKGKLARLPSFGGKGDPTGAIMGALTVTRDTKDGGPTNILNLSYRSTAAEDCGLVLQAVIGSYKDFLEATYRSSSNDTAKLVNQARIVLNKQLKEADEDYRRFRLDNPFLIKMKDGGNLRQERLVALLAKKLQLHDRLLEIEEQVQSYEAARREGREPTEMLALVLAPPREEASPRVGPMQPSRRGANRSRAPVVVGEDPFLTLLLQEQTLLEDYGADHPRVRSVRRRLEFLRKYDKRYALATPGASPTQALLEAYIVDLKREQVAIRAEERVLGKLSQAEQEEARKLIENELAEASKRGKLVRTQQLFESVLKRLQEINLVKDLGGFDAQTIAPPGAGWRVGPRSTPIFSVAIFLGLLAGLGLAYTAELADKSFRTPEEIRRRLGLPVVGYIPMLRVDNPTPEEQTSPLDPSLYAHHRPKSREAESYRGVRTALLFSARTDGVKVIQVTSPEMADGKTTLVANLAVSLAQSGKRVLLIDADFRRPRVHKLFGISGQRGLASVIASEGDPADVVQPSGVPGLWVLPCGPIPPNPAELLTSPRFQEALKALDTQYDFVLIDTPPLLAVTDPSSVVPCVDGVLLVIRFSRNARPKAERARDMLAGLGARVLGVIVNGVGTKGLGKYGYEHYHYGYGASSYYTDEGGEADAEGPTEDGALREPPPPRRSRRNGARRRFPWFFGWW